MPKRKARNETHDKLKIICLGKTTDVTERTILFLKKTVSTKCDEEGNTLLHYMVQTDDEQVTEYLIAAGCNVNLKNHEGDPPLAGAVRNNCLQSTRALLQASAKHENSYFRDSFGPLHIAASRGFLDIVKLLIENGADVNARNLKDKVTPLHAVNHFPEDDATRLDERCGIIIALLEAGADINAESASGSTSLEYAFSSHFDKGFDLLMQKGADINKYSSRHILFEIIHVHSQPDKMKRLIELGADLNETDEEGNTLLHHAFKEVQPDIVEYLLEKGLSFDVVNNDGFDPIFEGIKFVPSTYLWQHADEAQNDNYDEDYKEFYYLIEGQIKLIDLAVKRGVNINRVIGNQLPLLYMVLACCAYHSNILQALLRNGATFDYEHEYVRKVMRNSNKSKFPSLLLRHTAIFEAQNRIDGPDNFNFEKLEQKWQEYYSQCRDELNLMKATKIDDTNVSFFNILEGKDIGGYTRNQSIVQTFKKERNVSDMFPIYSDVMIYRFLKELETQSLVEKAKEGLSYVLQWDENSVNEILDIILSYLDEKDLKNLANI